MTEAVTKFLETSRRFRQMTRAFGIILIAEDDFCISMFLKKVAEAHGLRAEIVSTSEDAMTLIQENSEEIRCVIIDLHLRDSEGAEVIHFIETRHTRVPYLVYTGDLIAAREVTERFPRATVLRKGESIERMIDALGFSEAS